MSTEYECRANTPCGHQIDEHDVSGCADGCGCTWMPQPVSEVEPGGEPPFTTPEPTIRPDTGFVPRVCIVCGHASHAEVCDCGCKAVAITEWGTRPVPDTERRERWDEESSGWYEVINPRNATTCIALVYADGSLYLPEGEAALTEEEFHFAAARGNAYRLIRVDAALAVADEEQREFRTMVTHALRKANDRNRDLIARLGQYADRGIANGQEAERLRGEQEQARTLLTRAESYLSALHGSVARHDNLGANFGCAGCELRDQVAAELRRMAAAASGVQPDTRPVPDTEAATTADRGTALWAAAGAVALDRDASAGVPAAYREGMTRAVVLLGRLAEEATARPVPDTERRAGWDAVWPDPFGTLTAEQADAVQAMKAKLRSIADEEQQDLRAELDENTGVMQALRRQRDKAESETARLRAELEQARAIRPAEIQDCQVCGAGYTFGQPCQACAFKALMAAAGSGGQAEDGAQPERGDAVDSICGDRYDDEICEQDPGHSGTHGSETLGWGTDVDGAQQK